MPSRVRDLGFHSAVCQRKLSFTKCILRMSEKMQEDREGICLHCNWQEDLFCNNILILMRIDCLGSSQKNVGEIL